MDLKVITKKGNKNKNKWHKQNSAVLPYSVLNSQIFLCNSRLTAQRQENFNVTVFHGPRRQSFWRLARKLWSSFLSSIAFPWSLKKGYKLHKTHRNLLSHNFSAIQARQTPWKEERASLDLPHLLFLPHFLPSLPTCHLVKLKISFKISQPSR